MFVFIVYMTGLVKVLENVLTFSDDVDVSLGAPAGTGATLVQVSAIRLQVKT